MSAWKAGKILWFDEVTGEGVVVDDQGTPHYLHQSAVDDLVKTKKGKASAQKVKENLRVKFTVYQNAYQSQVDKIKEA